MRNYGKILTCIMVIFVFLYLFSLIGCGVAVTSDSAQFAVDDAKSTVESARASQADVYSKDRLKSAERLLDEAENSLSRNRWQRAYTLAKKAGESAQIAEQEAIKQLNKESIQPVSRSVATPDTTVVTKSPQLTTPTRQSVDYPANALTPQPALIPAQPLQQALGAPPAASTQKDISMPELQNRIQATFQALQSAQNSIQAARLLMVKIQVDLGLLMMDTNIQLLQKAGATPETISIIQSMYNQVQQSSIAGNYDYALRILDQINAYIRALFTPAQ